MIFSWDGEKIAKVFELPDTDAYRTPDGEFADLGVIWKEVNIFFVPLVTYEERFCFVTRSSMREERYFNYDAAVLPSEVSSIIGTASSRIPSWNRLGGKFLLLLIVVSSVVLTVKRKGTAQVSAARNPQGAGAFPKQTDSSHISQSAPVSGGLASNEVRFVTDLCPYCTKGTSFPEPYLGRTIHCKECNTDFVASTLVRRLQELLGEYRAINYVDLPEELRDAIESEYLRITGLRVAELDQDQKNLYTQIKAIPGRADWVKS